MNKERILALADLVEKQPHTKIVADNGFSMQGYVHSCGTPSCIAGWAAWLSFRKPKELADTPDIFDRAKRYLGIGERDAFNLFMPLDYYFGDNYPPEQAASTLRHLAETGVVDWSASPLPTDNGRAE